MNPLLRLKLSHFKGKLIRRFSNRPKINSVEFSIGKNVVFGKNVVINARNVSIGDGCVINDNVIINGDEFKIGDYGTIYHDCFFPGGNVKIGHNFWLGMGSIVDGRAGTIIGDNVGVGAQSQLWTHMVFGDMMQGCRFHNETSMNIGNDVWFAGHNLVSPINAGDRSLAMFGSLITKDMLSDKTYAGSPAKDITEKVGSQFEDKKLQDKVVYLKKYLNQFSERYNLGSPQEYATVFESKEEGFTEDKRIQINIEKRMYKKTNSTLEYHLIRFLLPDIKLTPSE